MRRAAWTDKLLRIAQNHGTLDSNFRKDKPMDSPRAPEVVIEGIRRKRLMWLAENVVEAAIFKSRWLLAPAYIVLVACLFCLMMDTLIEFTQFIRIFFVSQPDGERNSIFNETRVILQVLTIVDIVLFLNLVIMVILVGYTNFVSKIHPGKIEDWPIWIGVLDYSGLKIQIMGSIIAICSVKILREFVEISDYSIVKSEKLLWMIVLYASILLGTLVIAVVNKLNSHALPHSVVPVSEVSVSQEGRLNATFEGANSSS